MAEHKGLSYLKIHQFGGELLPQILAISNAAFDFHHDFAYFFWQLLALLLEKLFIGTLSMTIYPLNKVLSAS